MNLQNTDYKFADQNIFQAANPDWNPADPSGSLYLSKMADLNSHFQYPHYRRRFASNVATYTDGPGNVAVNNPFLNDIGTGGGPSESVYDKGLEYDQALRQSRLAAAVRKRGPGAQGVMGLSTLLAASVAGPSSLGMPMGPGAASVYGAGELAAAPSVVLGDSQGSVHLKEGTPIGSETQPEDVAVDGGVGSGLGESYVDGTKRFAGKKEEDEDGMEDGGVLGLLAQIYGRRDGPPVGL